MFGNRHEEQPERPRGRRHQPREMTGASANPNPETEATTKANTDRYAPQRERMQEGESFLEQMYKSERPGRNANGVMPSGGKRRASGQHDNLNVFAWDNGTGAPQNQRAPRGAAQPTASQAPTAAIDSAAPGANQRLRDIEAQKFEANNDGGFLRFSEDAKRQPAQGKAAARGGRPTAPYGSPEHGMMDALMRDPTTKSTANKTAANHERSAKRHVQQPKTSDGPEFAGFPGMGARSQEKQIQHIRRKEVPSSVFLPEAVPGLSAGGAPRAPANANGSSPATNSAPGKAAPPPSASYEDEGFDDMMAAVDPSQLTDEELHEYVAYLRYRQGGQDGVPREEPSGAAQMRGAGSAKADPDEDETSSQARRIMLYQQRQRGHE